MGNRIVGLKYSGTALPTGSATFVLFSTAAPSAGVAGSCPMANWAPMSGLHVYNYDVKHSHDGTVKGYKSDDRGTNWLQFYDSGTLTAPAATDTNGDVVSVEGMPDFKFEWVNGGTNQTTFEFTQNLSDVP